MLRALYSSAAGMQSQQLNLDVIANNLANVNTVFSYNVADVSLKFTGKGTVTDAQRKGWFTRIWDKNTPF